MSTDNIAQHVEIYEERKGTQGVGDEAHETVEDVYLGKFLVHFIPRRDDLLSLTAFGAPNFDGFIKNVYRVVGVLHEGRHLAWETLAEEHWEQRSLPRTKIFVMFNNSVDGKSNTRINYILRRDGQASLPSE